MVEQPSPTISLPEIPPQGPGPHFIIGDDGKIDFAPPEAIDQAGNNVARLRALHPILRNLVKSLCEGLDGGNKPYSNLSERAQSYRTIVDQELHTVPFDRLYVEGVRLQNSAAATREMIASKELPPFDASVSEPLDSLLNLHGPFMLSTAVGLELMSIEERYKRTPQQEDDVRKAMLAFAEQLKNRPDLATPRAAEFVLNSSQDMGTGPNLERSAVVATGVMKNVAVVVVSAAAFGALPVLGAAVAGTAGTVAGGVAVLIGFEAIKKSKSFQAIVTIVTPHLDHLSEADLRHELVTRARALLPFTEFVLKTEEILKRLGAANQFEWLNASVDWFKRRYPDVHKSTDQEDGEKQVQPIELVSLTVIAGTHGPQRATIKLRVNEAVQIEEGEGNGPIDAIFNTLRKLVDESSRLDAYVVGPMHDDLRAPVTVQLSREGKMASGRSTEPDLLIASAKAYIGALNELTRGNYSNPLPRLVPAFESEVDTQMDLKTFERELDSFGFRPSPSVADKAFAEFQRLVETKQTISFEHIEALLDESIAAQLNRIKLTSLTVVGGQAGTSRATIKLDIDGKVAIEESEGTNSIDAVFRVIKSLVPHNAILQLYQIDPAYEGTDAEASVQVRLAETGISTTAYGSDPDIFVASAKAYLSALNHLAVKRRKLSDAGKQSTISNDT